MRRFEMADEQFPRIAPLLPGKPEDPGVTATDHRLFVDAVLGIARTGAPWRDLPERFGNWNSVYQRVHRWAKTGVWTHVLEALGGDADLEWLLIDSTIVRAHQHAAGAETKGRRTTRRWAGRGAASAPRCTWPSTPSATRFG
jgi:putative transposase